MLVPGRLRQASTSLSYWGQLDLYSPLLSASSQALRPTGPDALVTTSARGSRTQQRSQRDEGFKAPREARPEVEQSRVGHSQPRPLKGPRPQTRSIRDWELPRIPWSPTSIVRDYRGEHPRGPTPGYLAAQRKHRPHVPPPRPSLVA